MASKASGTLVPIIEKQHASWSLMVTASHALELPASVLPSAPHSLRSAARGSEVPMDQGGGLHVSRGD